MARNGAAAAAGDGDQGAVLEWGAPARTALDPVFAQLRRSQHSGMRIKLVVAGGSGVLTTVAGQAAYRVVQEALTNVVRHAGSGVCVVVTVRWAADLQIEVVNTAPAAPGQPGRPVFGRGLRELRDRVVAAGGRFAAGLTEDGRWRVLTVLPRRDVLQAVAGGVAVPL